MNENITNDKKRQFCTFWISDRLYCVNILEVKEIITEIQFTPIPHAPEEIKGYVNIRGEIFLILGLSKLLGFEEKKLDENSKLLIFKTSVIESFGILVDRLGDIAEVGEEMIEENRKSETGTSLEKASSLENIISGTCKLKDRLMVILTAEKLLNAVKEKLLTINEKGD
ncbi:chemotaxis protein CheW [bacterium]|nr:chemotaxis protein CheW [bacterium]